MRTHSQSLPRHKTFQGKRRRRHTMRRNLNEHLFTATNLGSNCGRPLVNMELGITAFEREQRLPLYTAHSADKPLRRLVD
jgi:hypothetical protein